MAVKENADRRGGKKRVCSSFSGCFPLRFGAVLRGRGGGGDEAAAAAAAAAVFLLVVVFTLGSPLRLAEARLRPHIVNGQAVSDYRYYAFQVVLLYEGRLICGGSIIAPSYILTAGHCVDDKFNRSAIRGSPHHHEKLNTDPNADSEYYDVGVGHPDKEEAMRVRAAELWIHKGYNLQSPDRMVGGDRFRLSDDYAVLRLVKPLTFSEKVRSVALSPDDSALKLHDDLTVSGWGSILNRSPNAIIPNKLQTVTLDHLADVCALNYSSGGYQPQEYTRVWFDKKEMICAGCYEGGASTCNGDSGGPVTVLSSQGGCPVQVGVVSWGRTNDDACSIAGPSVFARVSAALHWIEYVVKQPVRSTVVLSPTHGCDNCVGNNHPSAKECRRASMYDLKLCDVQSRLARSFILTEPRCEGGKHELRAFINFHRGFPGATEARKRQFRQGVVYFLHSEKGPGNGVASLPLGQTTMVKINTPLKKPRFAGNPPVEARFDPQEGAWVYRWPSCSPQHTYAALYVLDAARDRKYFQISVAVGRVPSP